MPRGAEYSDGHPASDNAIEAGENKLTGAPQGSDVSDSPASQTLLCWLILIKSFLDRIPLHQKLIDREKLHHCQKGSMK